MPVRSVADEPELITELIKRRLGENPHATAVECGEHRLSWRAFDSRVRHMASGLRAARVEPGESFAVLSRNHPACIEAVFAAGLTGATAIILDWRLDDAALLEILQRAKVGFMFVGREFVELLERIRPELDDLDTVVVVGPPEHNPGGTDDYELWIELHEASEGMYAKYRPKLDDEIVQAHPSDGEQHVSLSHRALHRAILAALPAKGATAGEVVVVQDPLFLVRAVLDTLHGLHFGERTVLLRG